MTLEDVRVQLPDANIHFLYIRAWGLCGSCQNDRFKAADVFQRFLSPRVTSYKLGVKPPPIYHIN